jgi:transcriptional/translational regulatory protein YebC/TACO1
MFAKKGTILVDKETIGEEELMGMALDAGAEDVVEEDNTYQVVTLPEDFETVREALEQAGVQFLEASVSMVPKTIVEISEEKTARQILKLLESLEDHDDVQNVFANFDIPDEIMEAVS